MTSSIWKFTRKEVADNCLAFGPQLKLDGITDSQGRPLDGAMVMWAFALNESYHEPKDKLPPDFFVCPPRFEPAYWNGGRYANERHQAELNIRFGKDGPCSYGCWQVMLVNTDFRPEEFERCSVGARSFVSFLNGRVAAQQPKTLRDLGDLYNSGNCHDRNEPLAYMDRLEHNFSVPILEDTQGAGI